ncbi:MAG: CDP-glycerol glycerophosphotransferase family protein [Verrucomicrobiota bacterium]
MADHTTKLDKLLRLALASARIAIDRLRRRKIVMLHLAIAGQIQYLAPLVAALRSAKANIAFYLAKEGNWEFSHPNELGIPPERVLEGPVYSHARGIDVFITSTQFTDRPPNTQRICIFHGQPSKGNTFLPENMQLFDQLFLLGPLQHSLYDEFAAQYPSIAKNIRTLNVGYPKSDALLRGQFRRETVLSDLGLVPAKPTILFAPAYDKGTALDIYGESLIETLMQCDVNVLVKLHPMQYDPEAIKSFSGGINWPERLRTYAQHTNFRLLGNQPIDPLLAASDVMLTDISGVAFEFMMLDRPVIFIDCPKFFKEVAPSATYRTSSERVQQDIRCNAGRSAGLVVRSLVDLPAAIQRSLANPSEFSQQRKELADQLLYNPGRAATAAANAVLELLGLPDRVPND